MEPLSLWLAASAESAASAALAEDRAAPAQAAPEGGPASALPAAPPAPTAALTPARDARLTALRSTLRQRFPAALPVETPAPGAPRGAPVGVPTGVAALDALLPGGGLPRGRVTEWACARSGGSATLLRPLVQGLLARGEAVALVDAGRTLAAAEWVAVARAGALTVVRPPAPEDGPWCAELLLRTGAFALVVLDGVGVPPRSAPRLAHRVREAGCAFLVVQPDDAGAWQRNGHSAAALRLALSPAPGDAPGRGPGAEAAAPPEGEATVRASLVKGAPPAQTELRCVVPAPNRLCAHPLVPDRRGGARHGRSW